MMMSSGGSPVSFVPSDLESLVAWWDADDASTITDTAGAVTAWSDKSGNGNTLSTHTGAPTTGVRTMNSLNVLDFDGNDILAASPLGVTTSQTIIVVTESDDFANTTVLLEHSTNTNNLIGMFLAPVNPSSNAMTSKWHGSNNPNTAETLKQFQTDWSTATPYVITTQCDGTHAGNIMRRNGTLLNVTNVSDALDPGVVSIPGSFFVGGRSSGIIPYNGSIGELLIYDGALSTSDLEDVEAYLANKWGVTL